MNNNIIIDGVGLYKTRSGMRAFISIYGKFKDGSTRIYGIVEGELNTFRFDEDGTYHCSGCYTNKDIVEKWEDEHI